MAMTRRGFLAASLVAALGAVAGRAAGAADAAVAGAAPMLRPSPAGSSASRCSRCGSPEHTALAGACAEGAETARAVQVSARGLTRASRRDTRGAGA